MHQATGSEPPCPDFEGLPVGSQGPSAESPRRSQCETTRSCPRNEGPTLTNQNFGTEAFSIPYMCVCVSIHEYYICICICICICIYIYMCVIVYIYIYIYMCVIVYIYTHNLHIICIVQNMNTSSVHLIYRITWQWHKTHCFKHLQTSKTISENIQNQCYILIIHAHFTSSHFQEYTQFHKPLMWVLQS